MGLERAGRWGVEAEATRMGATLPRSNCKFRIFHHAEESNRMDATLLATRRHQRSHTAWRLKRGAVNSSDPVDTSVATY